MKKQFSPDANAASGGKRDGDYIPRLEADLLITNEPSRPNCFEIDAALLTSYMNEVNADKVRIVLAKTTTGDTTAVVYCMKAGVSVFHDNGGIECVLEHVFPFDVNAPI